jgi:hypothetical protein
MTTTATAPATRIWTIEEVRSIRDQMQAGKIDGILVDIFTAGAIVAVFDALGQINRDRAQTLPLPTFANFAISKVR